MPVRDRPAPVDEIEIATLRDSSGPNTSSDDSGDNSARDFARPVRPFASVNPDISHPALASRGWDSSTQTLTNPPHFDSQPPSPVWGWGMESSQSGGMVVFTPHPHNSHYFIY